MTVHAPFPERDGNAATARGRLAALDRRDAVLIAAFLVLLVASRLAWMFSSLGSASYWEEEYRWVAAREITAQPVMPLLDYQADHYQGGSLVMILLATGLFRLLGESPIVLKLTALLFSCGTLTLLYVVGRKALGRTTAVCASLAYLAGPPVLAWTSIVVMGSHTESILFSLVEILLFLGLLTGEWRSSRGWLALGLVSGLGLWFCYTSGLTLAACALTWLALERPPRVRELAFAIAGGIAGLVPWLWYNAGRGFVGIERVFQLFGAKDPIDPWVAQGPLVKLSKLVFEHGPLGLTSATPAITSPLEVALAAGFALPLAIGLLLAAWRVLGVPIVNRLGAAHAETAESAESRRREAVFVVYGIVFLGFYLTSRFTVDPNLGPHEYRLLGPAIVLLLIPAAHSAARAMSARTPWRGVAAATLAVFLLATSTASVAFAYELRNVGKPFSGLFGHMVRGVLLHRKYENDLIQAVDEARLVPDERARFNIFSGIGWGLEYRYQSNGEMEPIELWLTQLDGAERRGLVSGIRWSANRRKARLQMQRKLGTTIADPSEEIARLDALLALAEQTRRGKPARARPPANDASAEQ